MNSNTKFLDPEQVLYRAGLSRGNTVVDFGAGSGYFALASAKISGAAGRVFVVDILETALDHVMAEARLKQYKNIETYRADLEKSEVKAVVPGSADLVVAANIFHQVSAIDKLFTEAYRLLKTGGKLLIVDWNTSASPFGPKPDTRIAEDTLRNAAGKSNLKFNTNIETDQYHYGLIFTK